VEVGAEEKEGGREREQDLDGVSFIQFCVEERGDSFLPSSSPRTQNGLHVCLFCWSVFLSVKTLWRTHFAFASPFAKSVGDSLTPAMHGAFLQYYWNMMPFALEALFSWG